MMFASIKLSIIENLRTLNALWGEGGKAELEFRLTEEQDDHDEIVNILFYYVVNTTMAPSDVRSTPFFRGGQSRSAAVQNHVTVQSAADSLLVRPTL